MWDILIEPLTRHLEVLPVDIFAANRGRKFRSRKSEKIQTEKTEIEVGNWPSRVVQSCCLISQDTPGSVSLSWSLSSLGVGIRKAKHKGCCFTNLAYLGKVRTGHMSP